MAMLLALRTETAREQATIVFINNAVPIENLPINFVWGMHEGRAGAAT